jgi:drug/metabolite transporter (DMT)-like permease
MSETLRLTRRRPSVKVIGAIAVVVMIVMFSLGSTLVKRAETPGQLVAFWRMLITCAIWHIIVLVTGHRPSWANLRRAALPGILFGLNIAAFFVGATHNTVANAEIIGAMTPFLVVPIGARFFGERLNSRALLFALVAMGGVGVVLFSAPARGDASTKGNILCALAILSWTGYIVATRRLRGVMDVASYMAAMTLVATVTLFPIALSGGGLTTVSSTGWTYILILTLMTGIGAHGLMVFVQRTIPISSIGVAQIAQPALAAVWSYLLLDESLHGWQFVGMLLVIGGLLGFVVLNQAVRSPPEEQPTGELAGTAG